MGAPIPEASRVVAGDARRVGCRQVDEVWGERGGSRTRMLWGGGCDAELGGGGNAEVGVAGMKAGGPPACPTPRTAQGGGGRRGGGGLAGEHGNPRKAPARKLSLEGIFHWCQQEQDGLRGDSQGGGAWVHVREQGGCGSVRGTGRKRDSSGEGGRARELHVCGAPRCACAREENLCRAPAV